MLEAWVKMEQTANSMWQPLSAMMPIAQWQLVDVDIS
jgi:hypothetical protein